MNIFESLAPVAVYGVTVLETVHRVGGWVPCQSSQLAHRRRRPPAHPDKTTAHQYGRAVLYNLQPGAKSGGKIWLDFRVCPGPP